MEAAGEEEARPRLARRRGFPLRLPIDAVRSLLRERSALPRTRRRLAPAWSRPLPPGPPRRRLRLETRIVEPDLELVGHSVGLAHLPCGRQLFGMTPNECGDIEEVPGALRAQL